MWNKDSNSQQYQGGGEGSVADRPPFQCRACGEVSVWKERCSRVREIKQGVKLRVETDSPYNHRQEEMFACAC